MCKAKKNIEMRQVSTWEKQILKGKNYKLVQSPSAGISEIEMQKVIDLRVSKVTLEIFLSTACKFPKFYSENFYTLSVAQRICSVLRGKCNIWNPKC